ncbi:MBL fold metallo-hydrolase [Candidatus Uhrbacteria bacterium]|nr:MBL fold metallo-hydrolase [Candidatus Uhrbacteria bacterium]
MILLLAWLLAIVHLRDVPELTVTFFDVGQGDSTFIEWKDGTQMLVDGGPSTDVLSLLGRRMLPWDHHLDYIVLSHPHADHARGLVAVLERFSVDEIITTSVGYDSDWFRAFVSSSAVSSAKTVAPWDATFPDDIELIYPLSRDDVLQSPNVNETSLVFQMNGTFPILFTGDIGVPVEQKLLREGRMDDISVLKVGHQGSRNSSSVRWLEALRPEVAVIMVGEGNEYGHPHGETLRRLEDLSVRILRTDTNGTIQLRIFRDRMDIRADY